MVNTTDNKAVSARDLYYYRRRFKNRTFARLASFFAQQAELTGITKKDIAERLNKDPAQITRWLAGPSNLTLDTLSDLLLAMEAEADPPPIVKFVDRAQPNYVHPLIASVTNTFIPIATRSRFAPVETQRPPRPTTTPSSGDISLAVWGSSNAAN